MSIPVIVQVLGWLTVIWLVTVHVLVDRGRLPPGGRALRIAGCAAGAGVIAAGIQASMWPVAALGLLWLRSEVFGHRHPAPRDEAGRYEAPGPADGAPVELFRTNTAPARSGEQDHAAVAVIARRTDGGRHTGSRIVDVLFKIEIALVVAVALVLFGIWAKQQEAAFDERTDRTLCELVGGC